MKITTRDGRVFQGTPIQIVQAMKSIAFGVEDVLLDGYIDWVVDNARRFEGVELLTNNIDPLPPAVVAAIIIGSGVEREILVRAAAYLAIYGRYHVAFDAIPLWLAGKGLSVWYRETFKRSNGTLKIDDLAKVARLDRNTVRNLKDGTDIPQGETILSMAAALAAHGIIEPSTKRQVTAAEIAFEMRFACATAQLVATLRTRQPASLGLALDQFSFLLRVLPALDHEQLVDLLVRGTESSHFEPVEAEIQLMLEGSLCAMAAPVVARARRLETLAESDPHAAMSELSKDLEAQARDLRESTNTLAPNAPNPIADFLSYEAQLWSALADGRELPAKSYSSEALRAFVLVMQATAPPHFEPSAKNPAEKEALLREAVSLCPTHVDARKHLAFLLAGDGRHDEALEHLREGLRLNLDNIGLRETLGALLLDVGDHAAVLDVLPAGTPRSPLGRTTRAYALLGIDRCDQAEAEFEAVRQEFPRFPQALRGLAECRRRADDEPGAREHEASAHFYATAIK